MVRSTSGISGKINQHSRNIIFYFGVVSRTEKELAGMDDAHEGMIWDMSWHPLGHMLVSGSNDHTTYALIL